MKKRFFNILEQEFLRRNDASVLLCSNFDLKEFYLVFTFFCVQLVVQSKVIYCTAGLVADNTSMHDSATCWVHALSIDVLKAVCTTTR